MRAAVLRSTRANDAAGVFGIEEIDIPDPGPSQVLVRVATCGVCASDLHIVQGITPAAHFPIVLGHEVAGTVDRVGSAVVDWSVGDRVLVTAIGECGSCHDCRSGHPNRCSDAAILGLTEDGGQADYLAIDGKRLMAVPDEVPFAQASIIADAVSTAYHALRRSGLMAGQSCVVVGLGGLGMHALLLASRAGAHVVGVDVDPDVLARAPSWGAEAVVDGRDPDAFRQLRRLTDGGADVALEFVGRSTTGRLAIDALKPGGCAVLVGVGRERLSGPPLGLFVSREVQVRGSFGQTRAEIAELLADVASGSLDLSRSVSHVLPLEEAPTALEMLEHRHGAPVRIVLDTSL